MWTRLHQWILKLEAYGFLWGENYKILGLFSELEQCNVSGYKVINTESSDVFILCTQMLHYIVLMRRHLYTEHVNQIEMSLSTYNNGLSSVVAVVTSVQTLLLLNHWINWEESDVIDYATLYAVMLKSSNIFSNAGRLKNSIHAIWIILISLQFQIPLNLSQLHCKNNISFYYIPINVQATAVCVNAINYTVVFLYLYLYIFIQLLGIFLFSGRY